MSVIEELPIEESLEFIEVSEIVKDLDEEKLSVEQFMTNNLGITRETKLTIGNTAKGSLDITFDDLCNKFEELLKPAADDQEDHHKNKTAYYKKCNELIQDIFIVTSSNGNNTHSKKPYKNVFWVSFRDTFNTAKELKAKQKVSLSENKDSLKKTLEEQKQALEKVKNDAKVAKATAKAEVEAAKAAVKAAKEALKN